MLVASLPFGALFFVCLHQLLSRSASGRGCESLKMRAQTLHRLVGFAILAPSEPGVGARVEHHRERFFFLQGERIELRTDYVAADFDDRCRQCGVAVQNGQGELDRIAGCGQEVALHLHHQAAARHIGGDAVNRYFRWHVAHRQARPSRREPSDGAAGSPTRPR